MCEPQPDDEDDQLGAHPGDEHSAQSGLVLTTHRLLLRAPHAGDVEAIVALANNRKVAMQTAHMPYPYGRGDAEQWIAATTSQPPGAGGATFAMLLKAPKLRLIGAIGFGGLRSDEPHDEPQLQIGYWLGEPYWGQGYATEAAQSVIDYAFGDCGIAALSGACRVSNPASRRVLVKCGFQRAGLGMILSRAEGGQVSVERYRLERSIWQSLKGWANGG